MALLARDRPQHARERVAPTTTRRGGAAAPRWVGGAVLVEPTGRGEWSGVAVQWQRSVLSCVVGWLVGCLLVRFFVFVLLSFCRFAILLLLFTWLWQTSLSLCNRRWQESIGHEPLVVMLPGCVLVR